MASGRDLFQKIKPILNGVTAVLSVFPNAFLRFIWSLTTIFNGKLAVALRYCLAAAMGAKLGENVYFGADIYIDGHKDLVIGDNVSFHKGCYLDARGGITIGNNVSVAHATSLISFEHSYAGDLTTPIKYLPLKFAPIIIADDVWLGAAVRVLAGTTVDTRIVIGAGSIAKGHLAGSGVYVGSPARLVKKLETTS